MTSKTKFIDLTALDTKTFRAQLVVCYIAYLILLALAAVMVTLSILIPLTSAHIGVYTCWLCMGNEALAYVFVKTAIWIRKHTLTGVYYGKRIERTENH